MYALFHKTKKLCLPIDIQLKLFDSLIEPILLYGSDVWGFEDNSNIERVHLFYLALTEIRNYQKLSIKSEENIIHKTTSYEL